MKLSEIIIRILRISLIPSMEWKIISQEETSTKKLLVSYLLPIVIFSSTGISIGECIAKYSVLGFSLKLVVLFISNLIIWTIIPYVLILTSAYLLYILLPKINFKTTWIQSLKLIVYLYTPLLVITFFIMIHPIMQIIVPMGIIVFILYSFMQLWYGVREIYQGENYLKVKYFLFATLITFVVIVLTRQLFTFIFGYVF